MRLSFPARINSARFGVFLLEEIPGARSVSRNYQPEQYRVSPHTNEVRILIWPPRTGVGDPAKFVAYAEHTYDSVIANLERICRQAAPLLQSKLDSYFGLTPIPNAAAVFGSAVLDMVKVHADGEHEIQWRDTKLVYSRHILVGLNGRLDPVRAHFDG